MDVKNKYEDAVFRGDWERCKRLSNSAIQYADATCAPISIMEIGCGTGEQLIALARCFPLARLTGIDISEPNIKIARDLVQREGFVDRINIIQACYLRKHLGSFDLIVSYSTLHLIPSPDAALFSKIAQELAPGGVLLNVIPFECLFNRVLLLVRRVFRLCRSGVTDALVFQAGKLLAGDRLNDQQLRERVTYMYTLPERLGGAVMRKMLIDQYGFQFIREKPEPHTSLAQPKHMLAIYRKEFQ